MIAQVGLKSLSALTDATPQILFVICVLLGSAVISYFVIRNLISIAFALKLFDIVDDRKTHRGLIPRLGGVAFLPVVTFTVCFSGWLSEALFTGSWFLGYSELFLVSSAMLIIYSVGLRDDLMTLGYKEKFLAQFLVIGVLLLSGGYINTLEGFLGLDELNLIFSIPLTFLLLLLIINAFNLIDGLDGLAGGLAFVAFAFYTVLFLVVSMYVYALICAAIMGVLASFLILNIWGSPEKRNKIFMGDTGSLTLGVLVGFIAIRVMNIPGDGYLGHLPITSAMAPLFIPAMDLIWVFFTRIARGNNPFKPDKTHIHHRILALGLSQRWVLVILLFSSVLLTLMNLVLSFYIDINLLAVIDIFLWCLFNFFVYRRTKPVA